MSEITGLTITAVRPMTAPEAQREGWRYDSQLPPTVVQLENGTLLYASADPEGNGPGSLVGYDPTNRRHFGFA